MISLFEYRLLGRVIVDEAHLAMTHQAFRDIMKMLKWLSAMGVQIVLMSASVRPSLEGLLFEKFGITNYVICRERTSRPNICYSVVSAVDIEQELETHFQQVMSCQGSHQAVIYGRSREVAKATGK
jgi:superfamily II DNA helicase RecQ